MFSCVLLQTCIKKYSYIWILINMTKHKKGESGVRLDRSRTGMANIINRCT